MKSSLLKNIVISVLVMYFVGSITILIADYIYATNDLSKLNSATEENAEMVSTTELKKAEYEAKKKEVKSIQVGGIFSVAVGVLIGITAELYSKNKEKKNTKMKLIVGGIVGAVLAGISGLSIIIGDMANRGETITGGFIAEMLLLQLGAIILVVGAFIVCVRLTSEGKKNELNKQLKKISNR